MAINLTRGFNSVLMLALVVLATNAWADGRGVRVVGLDPFGNPQAWLPFDIGHADCLGTTLNSTAANALRQPPTLIAPVLLSTANPGTEALISVDYRMARFKKCLIARPRLQARMQQPEWARQRTTSHVM